MTINRLLWMNKTNVKLIFAIYANGNQHCLRIKSRNFCSLSDMYCVNNGNLCLNVLFIILISYCQDMCQQRFCYQIRFYLKRDFCFAAKVISKLKQIFIEKQI